MTQSKNLLNFEKLVNLFSVFAMGTIAFILLGFFHVPDNPWELSGLKFVLFLIGLFSYEMVILSLISHYIAKTKERVVKIFSNNRQAIVVIVLGLTYLIPSTIIHKSLLMFVRDVAMLLLIGVGMPFLKKYFENKNGEKKRIQGN